MNSDQRDERTIKTATGRILVVDDEADILEILETMLSDDGHNVLCASNGEMALERLEKEPIDLVISDVKMPGKYDGVALLKQMKTRFPNTPLIFMTGHSPLTRKDALTLGAAGHLEKPLDYENLRRMIKLALRYFPTPIRQSHRTPIELKIRFKTTESKKFEEVETTTRNICPEGAYIFCQSSPAVDSRIRFEIEPNLENIGMIWGEARVAWISNSSSDISGESGFGVEFTRIDEKHRRSIEKIVDTH